MIVNPVVQGGGEELETVDVINDWGRVLIYASILDGILLGKSDSFQSIKVVKGSIVTAGLSSSAPYVSGDSTYKGVDSNGRAMYQINGPCTFYPAN